MKPGFAFFGPCAAACAAFAFIAGMAGCGSMDSGSSAPLPAELKALHITELNYHPLDEDAIPGDDYEFLEIKNTGPKALSLAGVGLSDGVDYAFPAGTILDAGKFMVLAANADRFKERYGFAPFGVYTGKLSNSGEEVDLSLLATKEKIASVEYADSRPWPSQADGGGFSLVPVSTDSTEKGWRVSFEINGSPGKDDPAAVVINEALTHTDLPDKDAIELYNPNGVSVDISGWYLTDDRDRPAKFKIPAGTTVPAKGYITFDSDDFNPDSTLSTSFTMNSHGEEVFLSAYIGGCRTGYCHGFGFGEMENGVTFGRHVASDGGEYFPPQKEATLGKANAGPRVGPVIISEVMYHPANEADEFVEVANISDVSVNLFDKLNPKNTWQIGGIGFAFPEGVTLEVGEAVVIIPDSTSESAFRSAYGIPASVRIFKKTQPLSNSTDTLDLLKPEEPFVPSAGGDTVNPYMVVERLVYTDNSPWPSTADGKNKSIGRTVLKGFVGDPANWKATTPTPGKLP